MLTTLKSTFLHKGMFVLALAGGLALCDAACSSSGSTPVTTGNAGHDGGAAGTTGAAGSDGGAAGTTGAAGSDGGAGTTGVAGSDGGAAGTTGAAGSDGGAPDPMAEHLAIINADTTGGVTITRAAPKDYNTCK